MVGFIHIAGGSTIIIESTMPPKKASFNSAASVASAASRVPGKRKLNDLVPHEFDAEKEIEVGRKGGASKKGRQEGQEDRQEGQASARTICLLCQKKPGKDVEWAHHLQQSAGGPLHPSGDQCFQCLVFHIKNFPHLSGRTSASSSRPSLDRPRSIRRRSLRWEVIATSCWTRSRQRPQSRCASRGR